MDKLLVLILCIGMSLSLVSCGGDSPASGGSDNLLPPEILNVTSLGKSRLALSWDLIGDGEESVTLERRVQNSGDPFILAGELEAGTTEFTDSLLNPNLGYEYRVQVFAGDDSAVSDPAIIRNDRVITGTGTFNNILIQDPVRSIDFNGDGSRIAIGHIDAAAELWNISLTPVSFVRSFTGHNNEVTSVAFSPDGTRLLTGSIDRNAILWNVASGGILDIFEGHTFDIRSVLFTPDGSGAVTATEDATIRLWDTGNGSLTRTYQGTTGYAAVAVNPAGTRIAAAGNNSATIELWNLASGTPAGVSLSGHAAPVLSVDYGPDGSILASGGEDNQVRIWDLVNSSSQLLGNHTDDVYSVAVSPDGKYLASASSGIVMLWNLSNSSQLTSFTGHSGLVRSVAFSRDGTLLASGGNDGTVRIYELEYDYNGWEIVE